MAVEKTMRPGDEEKWRRGDEETWRSGGDEIKSVDENHTAHGTGGVSESV
jgi:hypothetical protein